MIAEPPPTSLDGRNQRRPSATSTNSQSHRVAEKRLTTPFQLWLPPFVQTITWYRPWNSRRQVLTCTPPSRPSISVTRSKSGERPTGTQTG
jgi:hypothetical protein